MITVAEISLLQPVKDMILQSQYKILKTTVRKMYAGDGWIAIVLSKKSKQIDWVSLTGRNGL
jgi:hypothetical protein